MDHLAGRGVLGGALGTKGLGVLARALFPGVDSSVVPATVSRQNLLGPGRRYHGYHGYQGYQGYPLLRKLPAASTSRNSSFWVLLLLPVYRWCSSGTGLFMVLIT